MALNTGEILQNRYRVVRPIGEGGMGAVYQAWHLSLNLPVAVKEMTSQPGLNADTLAQLRQQFQQEAAVLARLSHPHLVGVMDFFEEGDNVYLVMHFVEGESLADRIEREGALSEDHVLVWAGQLLDALAYCHSQGVIHRDIKPQNVIVRPDGRAVLVDFGLVKLWDPRDPGTRTAMRGMGTPEYAPPEQYGAQPGHTDPRSDLYSLGATLYHALTGQSPPAASDRMAFPGQFVPVRESNVRVSETTEATVLRAMELAVENRFSTAQDMAAALSGTATPGQIQALPTSPVSGRTKVMPGAQRVTAPPRRVPVWVWALGGVAALAVLVGLLVLLRGLIPQRATKEPTSARTAAPASAVTPLALAPDQAPTAKPTSTVPSTTDTATVPATPRPSATPVPSHTPTAEPTPTAVATISTPPASATPPFSPTPAPSPTPTAGGGTPTPTSILATSTPAPPPTSSQSNGPVRIFYTVEAGQIYYLASTDPSGSQGELLDPIAYESSTCAGGTEARTLAGQSVRMFYGYRCPIVPPVVECTSPDGQYNATVWHSEGQYSMSIRRASDDTMVQAVYTGNQLNSNEYILWAPDSSWFYFTLDNTLHRASPNAAGYQPVLPIAYGSSISPDGSMILYLQPVGTVGAYDVWVANADGSNQHNVTNAPDTYKLCAKWGSMQSP